MSLHDNDPGRASRQAPIDAPNTNPPSVEPSAVALLALVQRLADTDLETALELSRLLTAAHQLGALAEQMIKRGRAPVALAWLRRVTREVDTLQAEWLRLHAPAAPRLQRERRTDAPPAARSDSPLAERSS